ncbi:hypothetical protein DFS34DRAFT_622020 [Phlyctochytrium arcticum]|nr:hypothetical protein DFS34DRAFT_622020 [Phlyctochytrium arcticum]
MAATHAVDSGTDVSPKHSGLSGLPDNHGGKDGLKDGPTSAPSSSRDIPANAESIADSDSRTSSEPHPSPGEHSPVRAKTYYNHLLTVANKLAPYPVHKCMLHNVQDYFKDPNAQDGETEIPKKLQSGIIDRILTVVNPRAKKARERARLREVLGTKLLMQKYNEKPPRIKMLFSKTPQGAAMRATARSLHRSMYGRGIFGFLKRKDKVWITSGDEFIALIEKHIGTIDENMKKSSPAAHALTPPQSAKKAEAQRKKDERKGYAPEHGSECTYTLLADGTLHFSKSDTMLLEVASKHCIHSSAAPEVVFSGTFRLERQNGRVVLVMDTDSGTYAPRTDRDELKRLKSLMEHNFPGLVVDTREYKPPDLDENEDENKDEK